MSAPGARAPLIVLEGIDGAGTTTQAERLVRSLQDAGIAAHATREPSTGPVGVLLREILAGRHVPAGAAGVDQTTLGLLFAADRADHLAREVEPALAAGTVVVSDRWYHSSLAYQGTGEDRAWIWQLNARARRPDLTIFLSIDPEMAARRRRAAGRSEEIFDAIETQRRVAAGYREALAMLASSERIETVDGAGTVEQVSAAVLTLALETCRARGMRPSS